LLRILRITHQELDWTDWPGEFRLGLAKISFNMLRSRVLRCSSGKSHFSGQSSDPHLHSV